MFMNTPLQNYTTNKIVSIASILIVVLGSLWALGYNETQWQLVVAILIAFGYTHFLVGFYYQCKSFTRKPNSWQYFLTVTVLILLTLALTQVLFVYAGYAIALFVGLTYFLLHGLFNEQTLLEREGGVHIPLIYFTSLVVFVFSLLAYSIPDTTFLFDRALNFSVVNDFLLAISFNSLGVKLSAFSFVFWGGVIVSYVLLLIAWSKTRHNKLALYLGLSYAIVSIASFVWGTIPYVYMYVGIVGYHFMTWFFFFLREMSNRPKPALRNYNLLHLLVIAPFLVGGWLFFTEETSKLSLTLFDYKYFVVATYIHISTSFMNDQWFQNLQDRVFGN